MHTEERNHNKAPTHESRASLYDTTSGTAAAPFSHRNGATFILLLRTCRGALDALAQDHRVLSAGLLTLGK